MKYLILLFVTIFFYGQIQAQKLPITTTKVETKIHVGPGTEDVVLDTFQKRERLLISCNQRRDGKPHFGEIIAHNIPTGKIDTLKRIGGPADTAFNPHGIDLVLGRNGKALLFVVNHYKPTGAKVRQNSIIVYEVNDNSLAFIGQYTNDLLVSPNDVAGLPDGSFYAANDSKHLTMGFTWLMEKLFAVRSSTIVYCDKDRHWSKATNHRLAYANGIHADANRVLAATTQKKDLAIFKRDAATGKLMYEKNAAKIKGMDNINMVNDYELLVASHPSSLKFLKHAKDAKNISPGIVDLVDLQNGTVTHVYANDGSQISGNSIALYHKGKAYIGQVFEDYLLVIAISVSQ